MKQSFELNYSRQAKRQGRHFLKGPLLSSHQAFPFSAGAEIFSEVTQ